MPVVQVTLSEGEEAEFGESIVAACAREMLSRYVYDDEGEQRERPSALQQQITTLVVNEIREQARAAAPGIVQEMLEQGVRGTNSWGDASGPLKPLRTFIAEEIRSAVSNPQTGRRGEDAIKQMLGAEVSKAIDAELKEALAEPKRLIVAALKERAAKQIAYVLRDPDIPF